jgi:hypothetical protein
MLIISMLWRGGGTGGQFVIPLGQPFAYQNTPGRVDRVWAWETYGRD